MERRKYLGHYNKDFIKTITSKIARTEPIGPAGYAGLVQIQEIHYPCMLGEKGSEICIADNGYSELTFLPDNENWQLTAIYDNNDTIVEWYFDITRKNAIDEKGNPYCDDLYLDAALMPDGQIMIFDGDELKNARDKGSISQQDFHMAHAVLKRLIDEKIMDVAYMEALCKKLHSLFM